MPLTSKAAADSTQVLGGRTRAALEREKALVLRSIKELEFDRAMGKVSEKDFGEMSARLRARADRADASARCGRGLSRADRARDREAIGKPAKDQPAARGDGQCRAGLAFQTRQRLRVRATRTTTSTRASARAAASDGAPRMIRALRHWALGVEHCRGADDCRRAQRMPRTCPIRR